MASQGLPERETRFQVPTELAGSRLDRALRDLVPQASRTRLKELIHDGGVAVDGEPVTKPSLALEAGQWIELSVVPRSRVRPGGPEDSRLEVVFEDEHLAAVAKPPGMVSHPTGVVQGGTVSELAQERWANLPRAQGEDRPGIIHRLDAGTSGVMLVAKSEPAAQRLLELFRERAVRKTYLALVMGVTRFDSDWIDTPMCRSRSRNDRMSVVGMPTTDEEEEEPETGGLEAHTFYETLERWKGHSYLKCSPRTGRTHQIRVHLSSIDHPLIGDRVYRGRPGVASPWPKQAPRIARQALHALELELEHPITREPLRVRAEPAADFAEVLAWLRAQDEGE